LIGVNEAMGSHAAFLRWLAVVAVVGDLIAAALALMAERGHPHAFGSYWAALFWTTTQLLTVSSQLPNPSSTAAHILDVVLELASITIVTSIAGSWASFFHHRRSGGPAASSAENGPSPSGASAQP
jgi:asparagine N-glycosylation enzyme membrane subunit Stt3